MHTLFAGLQTISTELKPLVILLDSLDQLSPSHQAHGLLWLPRTLPPNVHLVVSTLPDEYDLLKTLREAVAEPSHFVEIKPLGQSVGLDVLRSWMTEVCTLPYWLVGVWLDNVLEGTDSCIC
jgi:hypothetical protein